MKKLYFIFILFYTFSSGFAQNSSEQFKKGKSYLQEGQYKQALTRFDQLIKANPQKAEVFYQRSRVHKALGNEEARLEDLNQALNLQKGHVQALTSRGDLYMERKAYKMALKDYKTAYKLNPQNKDANFGIGHYHHQQNRMDSAVHYYQKVLEMDPDYARALFRRGEIYNFVNNFEAAIKDFTKALKTMNDNAELYFYRGYSYLQSDQGEKGLRDLNKAISLNPDCGYCYYFRAMAKIKLMSSDPCEDLGKAVANGYEHARQGYDLHCYPNP